MKCNGVCASNSIKINKCHRTSVIVLVYSYREYATKYYPISIKLEVAKAAMKFSKNLKANHFVFFFINSWQFERRVTKWRSFQRVLK